MTNKITKSVSHLAEILKKRNLTLVTAESCSGGGLAYYISVNNKSSSKLERGYVTYSQPSKEQLLNVKASTLQLHGAVSKKVAIEMALGALHNSGAQIAVALTGIAGPDKTPKSKANTKGAVWICCASVLAKHVVKEYKISGNRKRFCDKAIESSLQLLISYLEDIYKKVPADE